MATKRAKSIWVKIPKGYKFAGQFGHVVADPLTQSETYLTVEVARQHRGATRHALVTVKIKDFSINELVALFGGAQ